MAGKLIVEINYTLLTIKNAIASALLRKIHPGLCVIQEDSFKQEHIPFSIKDIWSDGYLWGVPKHRRSLEKRLNRKFGWPKYNWKPLVPKTNLIICRVCGHHHESQTLCGHCYERVKIETKEIQNAIENDLKLDPIKDEIVVLYEGEAESKSAEFWKGQRIVELPKQRPSWFHHNLLEPTTQNPSDSTEIKPKDLA